MVAMNWHLNVIYYQDSLELAAGSLIKHIPYIIYVHIQWFKY